MPRSLTRLTLAVGVPYLLALAAIAFWPTPVDAPFSGELDRVFGWLSRHGLGVIDYGLVESAANVVLFVPLGLLSALHLRARWAWAAVVGSAVISIVLETGQLLLLSARYASAHDVLMNTSGGALGAVVGAALRWWLLARQRRRAAEWDLAFAHIPLRSASGVVGDEPVRPS